MKSKKTLIKTKCATNDLPHTSHIYDLRLVSIKRFKPHKSPYHPKKEISTPAATEEPITPETLLAIQYCNI